MLKRQLLFIGILAIPTMAFVVLERRPILLSGLLVAVIGGWWAASPVSYPQWVKLGLSRALPLSAFESLALWFISR